MNAADAACFDDLAEALDYFESKASPVRAVEPPAAKETNALAKPSPTVDPAPSAPPQEASDQYEPLSLPWKSLRRGPFTAQELHQLPEALEQGLLAPPEPEAEDLYTDRVDRIVGRFDSHDRKQRKYLRELLLENPVNSARAQILALLEQGRTPYELSMIDRIRKRCRALFLELPRTLLWGRVFANSPNTTVSWSLAEQLWDERLYQRGELFRFFRTLCDAFERDPCLERLYGSVLTCAPYRLRGRVMPHTEVSPSEVKRRRSHLFSDKPWWGENLGVMGRGDKISTLGLARSSTASVKNDWRRGFYPYKPSQQ